MSEKIEERKIDGTWPAFYTVVAFFWDKLEEHKEAKFCTYSKPWEIAKWGKQELWATGV